jgi:hypothetical protein
MLVLASLLLSCSAALAQTGACEPWCENACDELNGNIEQECGGCDPTDPKYTCHLHAEGFGGKGPKVVAGDEAEKVEESADPVDEDPPDVLLGTCEFAVIIDHAKVNRSWLLSQEGPVLIKGAIEGWPARTRWRRDEILAVHGNASCEFSRRRALFAHARAHCHCASRLARCCSDHLEAHGSVSLEEALKVHSRYNMGHMVFPEDDCYAIRYRPYSPFLATVADDYRVPAYLHPMRTFQMGIGTGEGIGVPPENHPSAWFSAVVGRKRWIVHPPDVKPPYAMANAPNCRVQRRTPRMQVCDQMEGDTMWVPDWWWHETCGLDKYSVGVGGITFEGAEKRSASRECAEYEYRMNDIPWCAEHGCPALTPDFNSA